VGEERWQWDTKQGTRKAIGEEVVGKSLWKE
jgi:hypothetical protein